MILAIIVLALSVLGLFTDRIFDPKWDFGSDIRSFGYLKLISESDPKISDIRYPKSFGSDISDIHYPILMKIV